MIDKLLCTNQTTAAVDNFTERSMKFHHMRDLSSKEVRIIVSFKLLLIWKCENILCLWSVILSHEERNALSTQSTMQKNDSKSKISKENYRWARARMKSFDNRLIIYISSIIMKRRLLMSKKALLLDMDYN